MQVIIMGEDRAEFCTVAKKNKEKHFIKIRNFIINIIFYRSESFYCQKTQFILHNISLNRLNKKACTIPARHLGLPHPIHSYR